MGKGLNVARIIIDTDIGTNPDDALAISLAVRSPELRVEGITTAYGKVDVRARIARRILELSGAPEVRVCPGIEEPLLRNRTVRWDGTEGEGLPLPELAETTEHAVDFIRRTVMDNPGEITLVTIGPLTNVAVALIREPRLADHLKEIVMMGGVTRLGRNGMKLEPVEYNFRCDPEAASIVLRSGVPIVMVGYDVTRQFSVSRDEFLEMAVAGNELSSTLTRMFQQYLDRMSRDYFYLSDPLTIGCMIDRSLFRMEAMNVSVLCGQDFPGLTVAEPSDQGRVQVCLEVDKERFLQLLKNRVFGQTQP
jgi:purine nucleosidase